MNDQYHNPHDHDDFEQEIEDAVEGMQDTIEGIVEEAMGSVESELDEMFDSLDEELEEEIRESQNDDFMEGRATHFFTEITSILEYVPEGFELDSDEERAASESEDEALEKDLADVEVDASTDEGEETLVADETMKWDEEEEEIFEED